MTLTKQPLDLAALRAAFVGRAAEVALALLGQPNPAFSSRRELRFGNKGSLAVVVAGEKAGLWHDHENGEGGGLFHLLQRMRGYAFSEAISGAQDIIGSAQVEPTRLPRHISKPVSPGKDDKSRVRRALALWNEAVPIIGTLASQYLEQRRVLGPALQAGADVLRFHPRCPFGQGARQPCLVALLRDIHTDEPRAIQRTAVTPTGQKLGRKTLGPKTGAAIKPTPDENETQGLAR